MNSKPPGRRSILRNMIFVILFPALATAIGLWFHDSHFPNSTIVIVFLLSTLLTSSLCSGYAYGIVSVILEICLYNYFFCPPYYQFDIGSASYSLTLTILAVALILTSCLTSRSKIAMEQAQEREKIANTLFEFTNRLASATNIQDAARTTIDTVSEKFGCDAGFLFFSENGIPEDTYLVRDSSGLYIRRTTTGDRTFDEYRSHTDASYIVGNLFYEFPVKGYRQNQSEFDYLGIIAIPMERGKTLHDDELHTLTTMAKALGLVMDRELSASKQRKSSEDMTRERYRSNLLRSISHDLRTPLAGIMGTSEIMMTMTADDPELCRMARNINKESNWLFTLVQNILALTRLQEGAFEIRKVIDVVEDVMNAAADTIEARKPDRKIIRTFPEEIVIAPMDSKLIQQAVINLLDNACKHTPSSRQIEMRLSVDHAQDVCMISILDQGDGIDPEAEDKLFKMFYTTHGDDKGTHSGVGLGLPICDSIMKAHGGNISASNRADTRGACFTLTLPMSDPDQISVTPPHME